MTDPVDDKIKLLHTAVSQKYDVGTLDEFKAKLQDPAKRKAFYDGVGKEYDLGEFADFENKVKKKDDTFAFSLPGTIDIPELSQDGLNQLKTTPPSPSPEQQIFTGQIPEPQSSGITIEPTKEQDKAFNEAINAPQKSFEQVGIDYEKQKKAELGAKDYITGAENKENDPFVTFGKSIWNTLAYQLPSAIAGAVAASGQSSMDHPSAEAMFPDFSKPIGTPGHRTQEQITNESRANMIDWAIKHGAKGEEMTKDLVSTMDKVKDPIDAMNWVSYALGQATGQIPASVVTGGATSIGQEVGSIYLDGVKKIAADNNLTIQQVIDKKLDHPALALAFGTASGLLDYVGAKTVLKVPKQSLITALRKRAVDLIKTGGTEAGTEYSQTWIEQIGKGQVAGNDLGKSWEEANTNEAARERLESAAQGFVGGSGAHIASNIGGKKANEKPITQGAKNSGQDISETKQEENIPVQSEQKIKEEVANEPTGKGVEEEVREPIQSPEEESKQPASEEGLQPSESEPVSKSGKTIEPHKEVKASKSEAIKEVAPIFKLKKMEAGILHNLKDKEIVKSDYYKQDKPEGLKGQIFQKLVDKGYIEELVTSEEKINNPDTDFILTDKGKEFIDAVDSRYQTRKQVKSGSDLFPENSNIPELKQKTDAIQKRKSETLSVDETPGNSEKMGTRIPESGKVAKENNVEEEKQPPQVGVNPTEETIKKIESLNENESEGYNIVRLREAKEAMLNDPQKAEVAFKIMDFAGRIWGMEKDFEKHPLTHLSQFFYGDANSVKEFVDQQIQGEEQNIKTDEQYLKSLNPNKKLDQKSIKFTEDQIQSAKERITKYQTAYQNENPETPTQGSEVLHTEPNEQAKADAIKEANDIAKEHGFDSASHLLNSLKKRTGEEYATVQEVPKKVIDKIIKERENETSKTEGTGTEPISETATKLHEGGNAESTPREVEHKKGDTVDFLAPSGSSKTGTIEGFNEEKGKYKIRATNGTVWNVDPESIGIYEGEQASTEKHYNPPVGAPRKSRGKVQRVSVSPIYGADPKMLKQILIDLSKSIASKIYYAKRIAGRRRALGTYSPSNAAIHIKFQGDLDTTAHELGHSIDDVFDLLGKSNPAMEKELIELSKFGSKPKKGTANPKAYKLGEGLAEYIRAWLVNPDEAKTKYPETSKVFDSTIPKETVDKLRKFGDDIRGYAGLSGHHKIMSNVQFEPEKNENWFTTLLKNRSKENFELTWVDRLGQQWTNTLLPFEKAVKFLLDKQGITQVEPSKNPVVLARLLAGKNSKVQDILENGFIDSANPIDASKPNDVKLNRMIDPVSGEAMNFEWLITPLDNSTEQSIKEEQKKVISYLIAKRTVEMSTKLGREDFLTGIGAGLFQDIVVAKERLAEHDSDTKETKDRIEEAARRYQAFADAGLQYAVANGRLSKEDYKTIKDANLEYVALNRISEASPDEEAVSFKKTGSKALGSVSQIVHKLKGSTKTIQNPYQSLVENTINVIKESDRNNALLAFKELAVAARGMHQGEPVNLSSVATQVGGSGDNTITIFDEGKKEYWKLDADVYKAVKNITENIKLAGWLTALPRLLRWGIIHFPVFAVRNRIRDIGSRFVISKNAFSGLDINFKKGRKQATLEAYNNAGGGQAGYYLMGEDFYNEKIEEVTRELAKDKRNILTTPDKLLHNANNWYNNLIGSGETATRLEEYRSAFKQAKEKGLDDYNAMVHAAFKARDLLDFAVAGEQMKWINQIIPFSNASVQGLRKTINSAKEDPSGFAIRFLLYAVLPTLFMRMMAHAFDRDKEYAELPDYRRDLFYNIPVGENLWITIPKPFEIGVLSSGAERVFSKIFYGDKKALEGYAGSVARSTTPIDDAALAGPGRSAVEIMANYDFFRNEHIIPTEEEKMDLKLRNTESASRLGKVIGSLVASDPRYIDYLIKSNAGYFGDLAMRLSDIDRDHTRHPIDFTMTGLFRNDPVYDSKSVQHLMDEVKRLGIKNNDSFLRLFNLTLSDYFDQKDAKLKAEAGKNVRETAEFISKIWEGMKLEDIKFMEHDIKTEIRK